MAYPLQYFGLENFTDCIIHGVAKSRTWLSDFHFQTTTTKTSQVTWKKEGILFSQREGLILKHLALRLVFEDEQECLQEVLAAGRFCREFMEGLSRRQRRLSLLVPLLPWTQAQVSLPRPALVPWPWEPGALPAVVCTEGTDLYGKKKKEEEEENVSITRSQITLVALHQGLFSHSLDPIQEKNGRHRRFLHECFIRVCWAACFPAGPWSLFKFLWRERPGILA